MIINSFVFFIIRFEGQLARVTTMNSGIIIAIVNE